MKIKGIVFSLVAFLIIGALGLSTFNQPRANVSVTPPFFEIVSIQPGQSTTGSFDVIFEEGDTDTFFLSLLKVGHNDQGRPFFQDYSPSENTLVNWISLEQTQVNAPIGATFTNGDNLVPVNFTVDVPADAPPGSHFATILVSNVPIDGEDAGTSEVSIGENIAFQVLVIVDGEFDLNVEFDYFRTKNDKSFFTSLPVEFETRFINRGDVHDSPTGNIEIIKGGEKVDNVVLNPDSRRAFPDSALIIENIWSEENIEELETQQEIIEAREKQPDNFVEHVLYQISNFKFGKYEAQLAGFIGDQQYQETVTFWVIPVHLMVTIFVPLFLLALAFYFKRKASN